MYYVIYDNLFSVSRIALSNLQFTLVVYFLAGFQVSSLSSYHVSLIPLYSLDTDPYVRHTFWSTISLGFFIVLNTIVTEQSAYQRLSSVKTLSIARR